MTNNFKLYEYIKRKRNDGYTWNQIRYYMTKDGKITNKTTVEDIREMYMDIAGKIAAGDEVLEDGSSYDKAFEEFCTFIGKAKDNFEYKTPTNKTRKKILCFGDTHLPYMDREKFYYICEKEKDADVLVINGDFLNGNELSTHAKFKVEIFQEELAQGRNDAEYLASIFPEIYVLDDNHVSDRWQRILGNEIRTNLHFLMTHPYDYMLKGIPNIVRAKDTHKFEFGKEIGHCMMFGDALFSHGFISGKDLKSARKVKEWHSKWRDVFGHQEPRVVLHGHSHCLGISYDYNMAVIQTGTLASLEGLTYSMGGELKGGPPSYGYVTFEQENGVTDLSSIRVVKL